MKLNDNVYKVLKWVAQIALPALGTAYFALANSWGLPAAEQMVGTVAAVGTLLGVSTHQYNKDTVAQTPAETKK